MFSQNLKISWTVKGNIESNDDNDAQVVVDENGVVYGGPMYYLSRGL